MKAKLLILIFGLLLIGCKTTKSSTKSDISEKTETATTRKETASTITSGTAVLDIKNNVKTDEQLNFSGSYTKWSKPDSTGKQYPTETGTISGGKQTKTDDRTKSNYKQDNTEISQQKTADKSEYKSDVKAKVNEKTKEETKAPQGVSWGMIILTAGILFLVYLVLKRYKIL